jgi:hypothetical protein
MRATRSGATPPVVDKDPAFELLEAFRPTSNMARGLLEPEPAGVDDHTIQLTLQRPCRQNAAALQGDHPRPHALELKNAERAGFGCRRQARFSERVD